MSRSFVRYVRSSHGYVLVIVFIVTVMSSVMREESPVSQSVKVVTEQ